MDLARLGIHMTSDSVKTADTRLRRLPSAASDAERSIGRLEKSSAGVGAAMRGAVVQLAAFAGAAVSIRRALAAAEEYSNIQNRLLALGASHEQAASQIAALGEIARSTRAPLDATANLYTRLALTSDSLGASQQELMKFSETVGLALAASGTSAGQASGALTQLSQAMAGGVVRAEEFNSIMEGAPGLLIAVANGIEGVDGDIGKLRQMMLDGELTSEAFFNGMLSQSEALRASFENTAPTISQALTVLNDSFTLFVGQADQATGVTTAIAEGMLLLADNMEVAIPVFGAVGIAIAAIAAPISVALIAVGGLAVAVITHWDEIKAAFKAGLEYFNSLPTKIQIAMLDLALAIARGIDSLQASFEAGVQYVKDFASDTLDALVQMGKDALTAALQIGSDIVAGLKQGIQQKWQDLKSYVSGLGTGMLDGIKDTLGIRSPSREFMEVGRYTVEGLVVGIDDNAAKAIDRARQLGTEIGTGVRDGLEPVLATVFDGLVRGDIKGLGNNLLSMGQNSFSGLLQSAFKVGGGGFAAVGKGLSSAITGIGSALKTGVGLFGKLGGAISAAMPLIGAVSAAFSFFKKSTVNLDAGLKVAGRGMEEIVAQTYRLDEVTRFWGLSKKKKTTYNTADASISDPIQATINSIGERVLGLSEVLGLAGDNLAKTTFEFELSTKGLSDEQIQEAIQAEMVRVGNTFADAVMGSYTEYLPDTAEIERLDKEIAKLGDFRGITNYKKDALEQQRVTAETAIEVVHLNEEFAALQREGEGSLEMLERLVGDLGAVNEALYLFDRNALEISVTGAAAASALVELSGGLDQFTAKTQYVFDNLLTDAERSTRLTEIALDNLNGTFGGLGIAIPRTHAQFMAILNSQDLMTESGRQTYAALQDVASAFVQVNGTAQQAAAAMESFVAAEVAAAHEANLAALQQTTDRQVEVITSGFNQLSDTLRAQISLANSAVREAQSSLDALRGAISGRNPTETAQQSQARTEAAVASLARSVERGTLPGQEELSRIVGNISDNPDAFATREDYLQDFFQTNALLAEAEGLAQNRLSVEERMLAALEARLAQATTQNTSVVTELQENIEAIRALPASLAGVLPSGQISPDGTNALFTDADTALFTGVAAQINDIFNQVLGRNVGLDGLNYYMNQVNTGIATLEGIRNEVANSTEAQTGQNVFNTAAQTIAEQQAEAARQAQAAGDAQRAAQNLNEFGVLLDTLQKQQIESIFMQELGRGVRSGGLGYYLDELQSGVSSLSDIRRIVNDSAKGLAFDASGIPQYAGGTNFHPGGLALVGEGGPELVSMPRGSGVRTASQTSRMLDNSELVAELRELRREVGQMRSENNQGNRNIIRETERVAKPLRDWDENGIPAERTT